MYCDECGARIPKGAKYCRQCGAELADVEGYLDGSVVVPPRVQTSPKKQSKAVVTLGKVLTGLSVVLLFGFQLLAFYTWWGGTGLLLALLLGPIVAVLPLVYLVVEGFTGYFLLLAIIWLVGLVGLLLSRQEGESGA